MEMSFTCQILNNKRKLHPFVTSALLEIIYKFFYWHITIFGVLFMFIVGKDIFKVGKLHPFIINALSKIMYKFVYWHVTIFGVLFMFILGKDIFKVGYVVVY